jgi:hypothetical protein
MSLIGGMFKGSEKKAPPSGGRLAIEDLQLELRAAFAMGLRAKFPGPQGELLAHVVEFYPHTMFREEELDSLQRHGSSAVLKNIMANTINEAMLSMIRSQMTTSALQKDREGVVRWATEGLTRCKEISGKAALTEPQWKWVLENADQYISYVRQLKCLTNQMSG